MLNQLVTIENTSPIYEKEAQAKKGIEEVINKDLSDFQSFKCELCDEPYANMATLNNHMMTHSSIPQLDGNGEKETNYRTFLCPNGPVSYVPLDLMNLPYKCDVCDFQSSAEYSLIEHMKKKHKQNKSNRNKHKRKNIVT